MALTVTIMRGDVVDTDRTMERDEWNSRHASAEPVWTATASRTLTAEVEARSRPTATADPRTPPILFTPEDGVGDLPGLSIVKAEQVARQVATEEVERTAIDALVRAVRPTRSAPIH